MHDNRVGDRQVLERGGRALNAGGTSLGEDDVSLPGQVQADPHARHGLNELLEPARQARHSLIELTQPFFNPRDAIGHSALL